MTKNEQLDELFNREVLPTSWAWNNPVGGKDKTENWDRWQRGGGESSEEYWKRKAVGVFGK